VALQAQPFTLSCMVVVLTVENIYTYIAIANHHTSAIYNMATMQYTASNKLRFENNTANTTGLQE